MKVYDKSTTGTIIRVSEKEIYLISNALKAHADMSNEQLQITECEELIQEFEKAVYDG